jgi:ABC-type multidrug transport system fused ATPase/permease subunit
MPEDHPITASDTENGSRPWGVAERTAWGELRLMAPLIRRHRWAAPVVLLLGVAAAIAESVGFSLVILFLYVVLGRGADAIGTGGILGRLFEAADAAAGGHTIALGVFIFLLILGKAGLNLAYGIIIATVRNRISEDMRNQVHAQCLDIAYEDLRRRDTGAILHVLATETWNLAEAWHAAVRIAINLCALGVFGVLLFAVSWQITLIAAVGSVLLSLALRALSRRAQRLGHAAAGANRRLADRMVAALHGMRTIRAFGQEAVEKDRFRAISSEVRGSFGRLERLYTFVGPLGEIGSLALLGAIVTASIPLGLPGATTLAAVVLLYRLSPHMRELEGHRMKLAGSVAAMRAVREFLDRSDKSYPPDGGRTFRELREGIRFEGVTFTHAGATRPGLREASFFLPQGALTTIVGPSGSGKTTIVNLLLRLYWPDSGIILVDGQPLAGFRRQDWLARVSLAGQDTELLQGTIAENIRMGRPDASLNQLRAAAAEAGILDFIEDLPAGFETRVGEQGLNLSGGQRQRICLARALVRDPELLILDEATNAVDGRLEDDIRARLAARLPRTTILVITHRLETALSSDHVVCLADGRIMEEGTPESLISLADGAFRRMLERTAA